MDFVLKILNVKGHGKVRIQLWDMAGGPNATMAPLFIRNAVGCIIVGRNDFPETIQR